MKTALNHFSYNRISSRKFGYHSKEIFFCHFSAADGNKNVTEIKALKWPLISLLLEVSKKLGRIDPYFSMEIESDTLGKFILKK